MKSAIFIFLFIFFAQPLCAQNGTTDTSKAALVCSIYGNRYWGNVIQETPDSVFLLQDDGVVDNIPRNLIDTIDYGRQKPKDHFAEAGFVVGTPSAANFVLGYEWPIAGIRASGFYPGGLNGLQFNFLYRIHRGDYTSHYISLIWATGNDAANDAYESGFGVAYDLNVIGFSFEVGEIYNTNEPFDIGHMFQIGYVYQFR